jgi:hypothetical protein
MIEAILRGGPADGRRIEISNALAFIDMPDDGPRFGQFGTVRYRLAERVSDELYIYDANYPDAS